MQLSDHEIKVYNGRVKVLQQYDLNQLQAEELAWRLLQRDRDSTDDRRICLACSNLKDSYCQERRASKVRGFQPCKTVLWRCDYFKTKG